MLKYRFPEKKYGWWGNNREGGSLTELLKRFTWELNIDIDIYRVVLSLSPVQLFVTPMDCSVRLLCPWDSPGKDTGVGSYSLLQGIFLTQGLSAHLLLCRWLLYHWATREAYIQYYVENRQLLRIRCIAQGILMTLWWPKWEGNPKQLWWCWFSH